MSRSFPSVFSSSSFMVWGLTYKSSIYFDLILHMVYAKIYQGSNFILLHVGILCCQYHLLKRLSFSSCVFLVPLSKLTDCKYVDLVLSSLFYSFRLCSAFMPVLFCFSYCSFVMYLEGR